MFDDSGNDTASGPALHDTGAVTRREMLATLARAGLAAPIALSTDLSAQKPSAPPNLRFLADPTWNPKRAVVKPEDLSFLGFIRFAPQPSNLHHSGGGFNVRRVKDELRFFLYGNTDKDRPVLEYALPDGEPNRDLEGAPLAPFRQDWGAVYDGRIPTGSAAGGGISGMFWDEDREILWWSYGDRYAPTQHHPTIGASVLRADGTFTSYGPWRTEWHCQRTRGGFVNIPAGFARAYTGGKRFGIMAGQASGNANSPFGAILSAMQMSEPWKMPADVLRSGSYTLENHGLILHDINHRQARDTRYRTCGWKVQYNCALGSSYNTSSPPIWGGGGGSGLAENDTMNSCVWIDLPDKHGLLYFGQLATTPVGYSAPGDPDGLAHFWYGDPAHATKNKVTDEGFVNGSCCHGQDDPYWGATGPGAHYRVAHGWIYNPTDLVATAEGKADLWSRTPTSVFQWKTYVPELRNRYTDGIFSGGYVDPETRRLYVMIRRHDNVTVKPYARPSIMVFKVK